MSATLTRWLTFAWWRDRWRDWLRVDADGVDERVESYRYLRIGILAAVGLLLSALVLQRAADGFVRQSISTYFYSPVRTVFTGALMAVGVSMIAVYGHTAAEEVLLSVAGILAPIVALAPTTPPQCVGQPPVFPIGADQTTGFCLPAVDGKVPWPEWVHDSVNRNMLVYGLGVAVVMVAFAVYAVSRRNSLSRREKLLIPSMIVYLVVGVFFTCYFRANRGNGIIGRRAHFTAAIVMFVMFWGVVVLRVFTSDTGRYRTLYALIAAGMLVGGVLGGFNLLGANNVYWLEMIEIGLFGAFWAVNTKQHWQPEHPQPVPSRT